ncbi:unnamed protein product [Brachionus calyciflorus]|uniref:DNA helicase n=1 Tax=Brachionus calyciflorus TaxID=104777 RepID=A0A814IIQ4_9BILA|nr:unnamed protein product [Brachionus calyciflorus]
MTHLYQLIILYQKIGEISREKTHKISFTCLFFSIDMSLKPYQLIGLNWLCLLHKEGINGILADEMGLGKTCQAIAFLSHLIEKKRTSFHLIVVPSSTLDNWVREITTWNPNFYFTVYQGTPEERLYMRKNILNNKFERPLNAILTTYNYVLISKDDKAFFRRLKYDYCVFDEAHMLKNMESLRYIGLDQLNSKRRLLLTGTPIQNNFLELMSLLFFVMPDMFRKNKSHFNKIFSLKQSQWEKDAFYNQKVSQAKGIIQPFILRRLKTEVLKQLPKKNENLIYCEMTERQNKDYSEKKLYLKEKQNECLKITSSKSTVDNKAEFDLAAYKERKKTLKHNHVFYVFMELRKIANHPLLNRSLYTDDKIKEMARIIMQQSSPGTVYEFVVEDMTLMNDFELHMMCPFYTGLEKYKLTDKHILDSGKFQMLDKIFEEKKRIGDRCLLFSQFTIMLDIVEVYLKIRKITFIRLDGQTPVKNRQGLIDKFNNDNKIFVFLLTTKAGGVGINLTAANTVIIHDLDYNPFNDKQAEDRSHRIGQTKDVQVYTLLSKDSIDETMLKIQKFKLELGDDINGTNDSKTKSVMADLLKEALNLD